MTDSWDEFAKVYGDRDATNSVMAACMMDLEARVKWLEQLLAAMPKQQQETSHE